MRILVTGGCGFIGSWIAEQLCHDGHRVLVIDDLSGGTIANLPIRWGYDTPNKNEIGVTVADLATDKAIDVIKFFKPHVVYHLAANAREGASFFQPSSIVRRNTLAYANTLVGAIQGGALRRVVLFSSMSVYGGQFPPFTENMELRPVDIYGLAKTNMEKMTTMLSVSHEFEYVIIRPHNVFGPRQCLSDIHRNVIGIWMNKIMREEPITIYGDGEQIRAFSYIENSVPAYIKALDVPSAGIYNVGADRPITINNLAKLIMEMMGVGYYYPVEHLPDRHQEVKQAYTDHYRAKRDLGLNDQISLEVGIEKMAAWAIQQGPQEWKTTDKLEIPNKLTPKMWRV